MTKPVGCTIKRSQYEWGCLVFLGTLMVMAVLSRNEEGALYVNVT